MSTLDEPEYADPSEFPDYDKIDSETVVEPADGYDDEQADHVAEPTDDEPTPGGA